MSYNLRRSGGNFNGMGGRGRASIQTNFISSGQYQQNMKPVGPVGMMRGGPQQYRPPGQTRPPFQPMRQPHNPLPPAPLKSALKKEVKTEICQNNQQQNKPAVPPQQPQQQQQIKPAPQDYVVETESMPPKPNPQPQQPQNNELNSQQQSPPQQDNAPNSQVTRMEDIQKITKFFSSTMPSPTKMEPGDENGEVKKKTLILKGKISKKEKRGRRNKRLRKILVPKNALMVLNELVGGHKFQFLDKETMPPPNFYIEPDTYVASVNIEGKDHIGYGKSKSAAKTAAAENALRHIILSKINSSSSQSVDSDDQMEVDGEKDEEDVSWLHVASFAMHKLFSTWYAEGDEKMEQVCAKILAKTGTAQEMLKLQDKQFPVGGPPKTRKPAKQLPQNPHLLNPVMLLNQMRDDITYEEFSKTGAAPHIIFIIKTTVDGLDFYGKGGSKKVARKNCAFAACNRLYDLQYPMEEFDPNHASVGVPMF